MIPFKKNSYNIVFWFVMLVILGLGIFFWAAYGERDTFFWCAGFAIPITALLIYKANHPTP